MYIVSNIFLMFVVESRDGSQTQNELQSHKHSSTFVAVWHENKEHVMGFSLSLTIAIINQPINILFSFSGSHGVFFSSSKNEVYKAQQNLD